MEQTPTDVVDVLGHFGVYHGILLLVVILRAFPTAWTYMMTPLMAPDVPHWCAPPNTSVDSELWMKVAIPQLRGKLSACEMYDVGVTFDDSWALKIGPKTAIVPCKFGWAYNVTDTGRTAVSEWDLVCDNEWQKAAMQTIIMAGSLCGVLVFGRISDKFGRKRCVYICSVITFVFGTAAAWAPNVTVFNAARFFVGMSIAGLQASVISLFIEVMPSGDRSFLNIGIGIGYAIPLLLVPLLAWKLQNFRLMQLASGLSALLLLPFYPILQESPRWLIVKQKEFPAERSILKILRLNRRPVPNMDSVMPSLLNAAKESAAEANKSLGIVDLLRHPVLRKNTFCLLASWFCHSIMYCYIALNASRDPGNPYVNFALSSASEIPAALLGLYVSRRIGRRVSQAVPVLLAVVCFLCVQLMFPDYPPWYKVIGNMVVRFFILSAYFVMWIAVLEVFPTSARSTGFACSFVSSRLGAMLAPFIRGMAKASHPSLPYVLFAFAGIVNATADFLLPETLNRPLPDTLEEIEALRNKEKETSLKNYAGIFLCPVPRWDHAQLNCYRTNN